MELLNGKEIAKQIVEQCKKDVQSNNLHIKVVDILVGEDEGSLVYIKNKQKKFNEVGIDFELVKISENISEKELVQRIKAYNNDSLVNGIFIEMPLPKHLNTSKIINSIEPKKDLEGCTNYNLGAIINKENEIAPCTAEGIVRLLKSYNIEIGGKNCVIVGRSNIVGKPVALLMLNENATITICHSKTQNLKEICKKADILIVSINKTKFINRDFIKTGSIVVDVGIHNTDNGIVGDVDFEDIKDLVSYITPVPGGVGSMTTAILIEHTLKKVKKS